MKDSKTFHDLTFRDKVAIIIAPLSFLAAVCIGFIALLLPPEGVIDPSVLWFTAQLLVMVSTILGFNISLDGLRHIASSDKQEKHHHDEEN